MKIDNITNTSDLIEFLLDQFEQTKTPAFLTAANSLFLYEKNCNFLTFCLDQQTKWISVDDMLPEKDEDVLIYRGQFIGSLINVYTYLGNDEWEDEYGYWSRTEDEGITHWMPLPEPPIEKE